MKLRLLISAYACEPGKGSEPGVGWNWMRHAAVRHEVWVITRANNQPKIEAALEREPLRHAHFIYYDLPGWAAFWKSGRRGIRLYYYLWQLGAARLAASLHREIHFDLAHHLTFGVHWLPTLLADVPVPFVWGPVGGGEQTPRAFRTGLGFGAATFELMRDAARLCGEHDPFVRLAARRTILGLAKTRESEERIRRMGCRRTAVISEAALDEEDLHELGALPPRTGEPFRLLSVGRLVHWKGFEYSLRAFELLTRRYPAAEYWIAGDGPQRERLERIAARLGLDRRIKLLGQLRRRQVLAALGECDVLVHPSLHDSGGWVCLEGMAAARPVVCLKLGGPAIQVSPEAGILIPALSPEQVISDLSAAFERLAADRTLRVRMGKAGRARVQAHFAWANRGDPWSGWAAELRQVEYACTDPA